uniref:NR LBD domain-containing protein n=1 Tax=Angiostrongylus cantonensis TaxID=6313 RepID=A0A0K0D2W1_ANGCA
LNNNTPVYLRGLAEGSSGVPVFASPDLVLFDFSPMKWYVGFRKEEPVIRQIIFFKKFAFSPCIFHSHFRLCEGVCDSSWIIFRSLMPTKIRQWTNMCVPFCELHASFEEYALLKALTIWHLMFYKLSETGRNVCHRQRDLIMLALHQVCSKEALDPEVRMGSLLLAMSYVLEQVQALVHNYTMITFFDVMKCDSVLVDMFNY